MSRKWIDHNHVTLMLEDTS